MYSEQKIKFDVPYNGDAELITAYHNYKNVIAMIYGRAEDGYPQGRKTDRRNPITLEALLKQVERIRKMGLRFNYLINGTSFSNREFNKEYRKKFVSFVKNLAEHGVKIVTLGNLFLIEVVVNEIPEIDVFASVLLEIDCLARLKIVADLGPRYICLSKTLLKNFNALENIGKFCVDKIEPVLLANDPCLHHCPFTNYHNDILSHLTGEGAYCESYCRLHCTKIFASNQQNLISASFIRPEDLRTYLNLGYRIFKLCDRKHTTPWILHALKAYTDGYYDGNLSDIMAPWNRHTGSYEFPKDLSNENLAEKGIAFFRDNLRFTPYIDNRKLDGYLEHWQKIKQHGCRDEDCESCGYCGKLASITIKNEPLKKRIVVRNVKKAIEFAASLQNSSAEVKDDI